MTLLSSLRQLKFSSAWILTLKGHFQAIQKLIFSGYRSWLFNIPICFPVHRSLSKNGYIKFVANIFSIRHVFVNLYGLLVFISVEWTEILASISWRCNQSCYELQFTRQWSMREIQWHYLEKHSIRIGKAFKPTYGYNTRYFSTDFKTDAYCLEVLVFF